LKFGSLFAGIGGFDLGLERAGMQCEWQVEIDPYCQRVLAKHWPGIRRYADIRTVHGIVSHSQQFRHSSESDSGQGRDISESTRFEIVECCENQNSCEACLSSVDLICGGFPCQPFSVAGKQRGTADDRHLWPEMLRVIQEVRPTWVLGENVSGIIDMELDTVLSDLEGAGYETQALVIPACAVDAPHRRDRVWIVAHSNGRCGEVDANEQVQAGWNSTYNGGQDVADSAGERFQEWGSTSLGGHEQKQESERCSSEQFEPAYWLPEPQLGRVAHGIPNRVDRLKSLGNAVVPQIVEVIGRMILICA
jgi:DNA (cytosine-5)-methyltransferase 1